MNRQKWNYEESSNLKQRAMEARELRIGNIIHDTRHPERKCKVFRLTSGLDFNITYQYDNSKELSYSKENIDALQPIPLTEEWLKMAGFINYEKAMWVCDGFWIEELSPGLFTDRKYGKVLKYVHQLQNLYFAITGDELKFVE